MNFIERIDSELNEVQRGAVTDVFGPKMIVAGAGSGKTRVLTYRLAFILDQGIAEAQNLLALTFTNKAAKEMKERIQKLVGPQAKMIQMGTFHSIFARLLRRDAEKLGYTSSFTIYDDDDSLSLIKAIMKEQNIDNKVLKERSVLNFISKAKNVLYTPEKCREIIADEYSDKCQKLYQIYQARALKANAMDFGDLLMKPAELFTKHPQVLERYQDMFQFIMVDEYQDTNHAQYIITKQLAGKHHNICVVGDDAQSIYAFRGANIQNILNFKTDYPQLKTYKLEQNYRSTKMIVEAANSIIRNNKNQIPKHVFTANEVGDLIQVIEADSELDEAKRICDDIRAVKQIKNFFNKDFAILYRTNAQSRALEDGLRRVGIKYRVFGGISFYKRKEIKDIIAYLRLAVNQQDEQAVERVINYPARGIGETSFQKIRDFAAHYKITLWEALLRISETGLTARIVNPVKEFTKLIIHFQDFAKKHDAHKSVDYISKNSGILKDLHTDKTVEGLARWENVQELINAAKEFTESDQDSISLDAFLAEISLFSDADDSKEDDDYVTLMTIHSAKGLEFKAVYLAGLEDGIFPSAMSMETSAEIEEERRLFYVAITRAEKQLTISYAKSRLRFGNVMYNDPSRFLLELDAKHLKYNKIPTASGLPRSVPNMPSTGTQPRVVSHTTTTPPADFVPSAPELILKGVKVFHPKFGIGEVMSREGEGEQAKVNVNFTQMGQRVLLLKYAKMQVV
ncbi:MAG: ATP-dependent helicase [Bacteroidia bacterium]